MRIPDFGGLRSAKSEVLRVAATCAVTKPCRRNVPDERPLQPRNASHGGTSLTPRVPAAPCSGVADLVFVRLIIIIT